MASTIQLQRTINYAQTCIRNAPLTGVGGFPNEPAFSIADWVRQFILSAPFMWRWNRSFATFSTVQGVQDYNAVNYLKYSQDFTNGVWISSNVSSTLSATQAPDGSFTADLLTPLTTDCYVAQTIPAFWPNNGSSQTVSFSVWLRAATGTVSNFRLFIIWNFANGGSTALTIPSLTTTWTRYTLSTTIPGFFPSVIVQMGGGGSFSNLNPNILAWGAQLEPNGSANAYLPTTTNSASLFSSLGFIEKASISDGTNQKELQIALNLAQDNTQNRPISISPYIDNTGGVTLRLLPVPDKAYTVNVSFQNSAPVFANLTDTWAPIPDYYYYLVESGFLAKTFEYNNDERYAVAMQMFVKQVVAASAGMADTQKNLYLDEFVNYQRELQSEIGNSNAGRQGRGLF